MDQDDVIRGFVEHLGEVRKKSLTITSWPDKSNRTDQEIDAIIKNENARIAIEHTSIDSFPDQRKDDARFLQVFGSLEKELSDKLKAEIELIVKCFVIPKRSKDNLDRIKSSLKKWLEEKVPSLPDGEGYYKIEGIPFDIYIKKDSNERPGFAVSRFTPERKPFSDCIVDQLARKIKKLSPYKNENFETILLVESYDPALMSKQKMSIGVREALLKIEEPHPNQIWFVKTYIPNELKYYQIQ